MKKHLLLIDEHKDDLKDFMEIVSKCGGPFKCTYAANAAQALEMLRYLEPDFIFVNYELSGINGLQLLSAIRAEPKHENAKVYIYSREITEEIDKMSKLLGASGCVEKTSTMDILIQQFRSIFSSGATPAVSIVKK